jgi:hypothetical protein
MTKIELEKFNAQRQENNVNFARRLKTFLTLVTRIINRG